jgi:hypothetical protein
MKIKINQEFKEGLANYLTSLKTESDFHFLPTKNGVTETGKDLELGFSCLALKSFFILGEWQNFSNKKKENWANYINSFQNDNLPEFSKNSYIDENYYKNIIKTDVNKEIKRNVKKLLNRGDVKTKKNEISEYIRAESKQAISTLAQIGQTSKSKYEEKIFNSDLEKYLTSLNWNRPWNAGAQYSGLCVFLETQEKNTKQYEIIKQELYDFSSLILDTESGFYFKGNIPSESELINGAMKMITGFDWLGIPIHKPEKIIDKSLSIKVSGYGCDLVDIVYVLYKCSEHTNYRRKDILKYFNYLEGVIANHYFKDEKAFSYNVDSSQIYYYGLKITKGLKTADLHGTILLLWALSMINDLNDKKEINLNIIKP